MTQDTLSPATRRYRNIYGVPISQRAIYPPDELWDAIQDEVVRRTVRDGAGTWNDSRVVVDLLYRALGKTPPVPSLTD